MKMTSPTLRRSLLAGVSVVALAASAVTTSSPAQANVVDPGGSACSWTFDTSAPSTGKLKITVTLKCQKDVWFTEIDHAITVSGPSTNTFETSSCWNTGTCVRSVTVNNPAGAQRFEVADDLYASRGASNAIEKFIGSITK